MFTLGFVLLSSFACSNAFRSDRDININPEHESHNLTNTLNLNQRATLDDYDWDENNIRKRFRLLPSRPPNPVYPRLIRTSQTKNLTLIVALENTLIYCRSQKVILKGAININGHPCFLRPNWKEFLERASKDYELVIWSSGRNIVNFQEKKKS